MRVARLLGIVLLCHWAPSASGAAPAGASAAPSVTAFVDVNVLPMDRERTLLRQTVLVRGGVIEAIGPVNEVPVPDGALRIEGRGQQWLLPGLADMHTHLASAEDAALYLAAGVTTVLQMGGDGRIEPIGFLRNLLRDAVAPQVFFALMIDGATPASGGWPVATDEEARLAVRVAKDRHYDFVKLYNGIAAAQFDAIMDEARRVGLPVIGHSVRAAPVPASLFRGQVMVAHAEEFYYTTFDNRPDDGRIAQVAAEVRRSGAYVTPNLCFIDAIVQQWGKPAVRERFLRDPLAQSMHPLSRLNWAQPRRNYARQPGEFPMSLAFLQRFVAELSRQGVPLLAGTDSPLMPGLVPGIGLNEELRMLVESGLSPYQALSSATRTPGEFIQKFVPGATRFGMVAGGARADLVLVEDNPLSRLDTLRTPAGVMAAGTWRTRAELQSILDRNRQTVSDQVEEIFGVPR